MVGKYLIRRARKERGISVPEIAAKLGVSATAVWNWDRGKSRPRPEHAAKLADLLGIDSALLQASAAAGSPGLASDDDHLSAREIIVETKTRLARKLGMPESAFEISILIKR